MSASRPNIQVIEINSPEQLMMFIQLLEMMQQVEEKKSQEAVATATRTPSSPMMFRSPSVSLDMSPVMSHDCGKEVEAPKARGCGGR